MATLVSRLPHRLATSAGIAGLCLGLVWTPSDATVASPRDGSAAPVLSGPVTETTNVAVRVPTPARHRVDRRAHAVVLVGGGGNDHLTGGPRADQLSGGGGADTLLGGGGRDLIIPGRGADVVRAGRGADVVWLPADGASDTVDCGAGRDRVQVIGRREPSDRFAGCERVTSYADAARVGLPLRRVPWEGGPAYYRQFPGARRWTNPAFFPIGLWWGGISSDREVRWDKRHGINTYIALNEGTDFSLIADNHMYWIGGRLNATFDRSSPFWVGNNLGDEIDGTSASLAEGLELLKEEKAKYAGNGKFNYTNYTSMMVQSYTDDTMAERYLDVPDVASMDDYTYTGTLCDWDMDFAHYFIYPLAKSTCRTASSYGAQVRGMRQRDRADGSRHPVWNFVEDYDASPAEAGGPEYVITPGQLRGAVMSSIINGARGIIYFNNVFRGTCASGNILRDAQTHAHYCADPQVAAMKVVNGQIRRLARVLNTQSYRYRFGPGMDTMLKTYDGYAYIFAMPNASGGAGTRTFTLPASIAGKRVDVLFENRRIVASRGRFTDRFATESTYHIYRVHL